MKSQQQLVEHLQETGVLRTPAIIKAFEAIDRRDFIAPELLEVAYADTALPIGLGQTISQPYTVAYMLELLQPEVGQTILDIGSGSGWQTSLLAHIVGPKGKIVALEIIPDLYETGRRNVSRYSFIEKGIVEMRCQSGLPGYPEAAPYDRIIAAAAGTHVPPAWLAQTKIDGRIVTPINSSIMLLRKTGTETWEREDHPGFAFVPLVS